MWMICSVEIIVQSTPTIYLEGKRLHEHGDRILLFLKASFWTSVCVQDIYLVHA